MLHFILYGPLDSRDGRVAVSNESNFHRSETPVVSAVSCRQKCFRVDSWGGRVTLVVMKVCFQSSFKLTAASVITHVQGIYYGLKLAAITVNKL